MRKRYAVVCWLLSGLLLLGGVSWGQTLPKNRRATISPSLVHLEPGQAQQFRLVMVATRLMAADVPKEVKWSVNDVRGGDAKWGTIDDNGVYRAPETAPVPREIHVCAEVPEAANRYLWATVIVGAEEPKYRPCGYWSETVLEGKERTEHLVDPHGIAVDADGNLIIADQLGSQVLRFTPQGEFLGALGGGKGSEPGQFTEPRIIVSDDRGRIYISDSKGDRPRIQVFNRKGEFERIFAEKGMKPGMILRSHGMAFDPQHRLFMTDVDNMRVSVYDQEGSHLADWGREGLNPGEFNAPHGLAVDKNSDVFVTGYYGPTQKFNSEGDFLFGFCFGDPPDGPVYFHNMTGDRWGDVYVTVRSKGGYQGAIQKDGQHVSFMKFNNNGSYVTAWGMSGPDHRETTAVVDEKGRVYALFKGDKEMGVEIFEEE